jgi:hypothetical protein
MGSRSAHDALKSYGRVTCLHIKSTLVRIAGWMFRVISKIFSTVLIVWAGDQIMSDMEGQRRQLVTAADLVCTYTHHTHTAV